MAKKDEDAQGWEAEVAERRQRGDGKFLLKSNGLSDPPQSWWKSGELDQIWKMIG